MNRYFYKLSRNDSSPCFLSISEHSNCR